MLIDSSIFDGKSLPCVAKLPVGATFIFESKLYLKCVERYGKYFAVRLSTGELVDLHDDKDLNESTIVAPVSCIVHRSDA